MSMPSRPVRRASENDRLDRVFHALSDRTRRALLARLARGPAMVTDLARPFAMSLPSVSKHLRVLEDARLVSRAIDGRIHRCSLSPAPFKQAGRWLDHYRAFWEGTLESLAHYAEGDEGAGDPDRRGGKR
jgi:DNA-binding transcriptional ArsR family regulator